MTVCEGGCEREAPNGHEMCLDCLEGARLLDRNALRLARERVEELECDLRGLVDFMVFLAKKLDCESDPTVILEEVSDLLSKVKS